MWTTDTVGIGAFCVIGAQNAVRMGLHPLICVVCGMFTATFGGVVRDVVCNHPVRILHSKSEVYATTALTGSTAYMAVRSLGCSPAIRIATGMLTAMGFRLFGSNAFITLPQAPWCEKKTLDTHAVPHTERKALRYQMSSS